MMNHQSESSFYRWMIFSLAGIVFIFFPLHALVNPEQLPPMRFSLHFHALSYGAWYALACIQVALISRGGIKLHQTLGLLSIPIAVLMVLSAVWISYENSLRIGKDFFLISSTVNVVVFLIYYLTALIKRDLPRWHKRMMLFASISLMLPAFSRINYVLSLNPFITLLFWLGYIAAVVIYDKRNDGAISKPTKFGLLIFIIHLAILLVMGPPEK